MASSTIYLLSSYHLIVMLFAVLEDFKKKVTDSHDLSIAERGLAHFSNIELYNSSVTIKKLLFLLHELITIFKAA